MAKQLVLTEEEAVVLSEKLNELIEDLRDPRRAKDLAMEGLNSEQIEKELVGMDIYADTLETISKKLDVIILEEVE